MKEHKREPIIILQRFVSTANHHPHQKAWQSNQPKLYTEKEMNHEIFYFCEVSQQHIFLKIISAKEAKMTTYAED